jgi:hypothetical protein
VCGSVHGRASDSETGWAERQSAGTLDAVVAGTSVEIAMEGVALADFAQSGSTSAWRIVVGAAETVVEVAGL